MRYEYKSITDYYNLFEISYFNQNVLIFVNRSNKPSYSLQKLEPN